MSPTINTNFHIHRHRTNPTNNLVSTADTVALMKELAWQARDSEVIILALREILESTGSKSSTTERVIPLTTVAQDQYLQFLLQIFNWVKKTVKFSEDEVTLELNGLEIDPYGTELLIRPDLLLQMPEPRGDCDDFSTLIASILLTSRSFDDIYFVTIAADPARPEDFTHVYLAVRNPTTGKLVYMDASHGQMLGWEYPGAFKKEFWKI